MKNFVVILTFILISANSYSQYWNSVGGGTTSWVNAVCVYNGNLIVGTDNGIIKWNGTTWSPLGTGINGTVDALCVYNGVLYAGGGFTLAGGIEVSNVAAWNDTIWSDPEGGTNGLVVAMTVYNNELIIGGYFTSANGPANYIARWDGENWSPLGTGTSGGGGQVMAVTVYNGELIAGGFFSNAGGIPANHIAKWNGTNWSTLGSGSNSIVYSMTVHNNQLISDGSFITSGGSAAIGIGAWDGAAWSALGSGIGGGLYPYLLGLVSHKGDLYAGGLFQSAGGIVSNGAAMWNGTSWSPLNGGFSSAGNVAGAYAVCIYNNNVVFGGIFSGAGGVSSANVIEWVVPQVPTNLTIQNITVSAFESFCYDAIQVITAAGNNTAFHVLDGANVTMIAGEKIVMLPGTTVDSGGYLNAYITTTGQYCNTLPIAMAPKVAGSAETTPALQLQQMVSVYPNPTSGLFTLNVKNQPPDQDITVEIFNSTGLTIERHLLMHETSHDFSLEGQPKGIYFLRALTGKNQEIVKIIMD